MYEDNCAARTLTCLKLQKCSCRGSNPGPSAHKTEALPTAPHELNMRHPGIEPGAPRWQRGILPLNQWRFIDWQNDPGGTRTPNRLIRSQARYPLRHRTLTLKDLRPSAVAFVAEWSKALDSSSSPSCGRGFDSHRNHHFC